MLQHTAWSLVSQRQAVQAKGLLICISAMPHDKLKKDVMCEAPAAHTRIKLLPQAQWTTRPPAIHPVGYIQLPKKQALGQELASALCGAVVLDVQQVK